MRGATTREKMLLLVLGIFLLFVSYYRLFYVPMQDKRTALENQILVAEEEYNIQSRKLETMKRIKDDLETMRLTDKQPVQDYDNTADLIRELTTILDRTCEEYRIVLKDPSAPMADIIRRPIEVYFVAPSYTDAENMIKALTENAFRCQVSDVTITAKADSKILDMAIFGGNGGKIVGYEVNCIVTFYEYEKKVKEPQGETKIGEEMNS